MLGIHNFLWRLIPANPILLRVVETGGKRKRDLLIRCAYLGLLVALVVGALIAGSGDMGSLSSLAKTSASLFQKMSYLQLALVALLAPVFTAGAITQEKDSQTYDILLATPLTNGQIVLGSLLSRLFFVIALLISGIPVFSITQIFGGVAIKSIVLSFGIAAATAFATGALAMAIATFKVGTRRTIFSFYLFIVIYMAGGIVLDQFQRFWVEGPVQVTRAPDPKPSTSEDEDTGNYSSPNANYGVKPQPKPAPTPQVTVGRAHISWFTGINPFLALRVLFRSPEYAPPAYEDLPPNLQKWPIGWYLSDPAGFYISAMFFFSFVLVMPSIILLRRMAQNTASLKTLVLQKFKIVSGDRTRKPRGVWSNPIAWREAKTKASAAKATFLRYGFMAVGLIIAVYLLIGYASGGAPTRPVTSANYDTRLNKFHIPPDPEKGTTDKYLTVLPNLRPQVTIKARQRDDEERSQKNIDIREVRTPMQLVSYKTYFDEPPTESEYFLKDQLATVPGGPASVLKSIEVRPSRDPDEVRRYLLGVCAIEFAVILLIVTNAAASTVTREKEDGTLDLLLSSPITSRYYIWGKLRGLVSFVLPLIAVPVGSLVLFLVYDTIQSLQHGSDPLFEWTVFPEAVILLPAMLIIVSAFAAILGMQMSLRCRTTVTAVMSSVGIVVGICAAMGWCGFSFLQSGKTFSLIVGSFSPFTLMQMLINPYASSGAYNGASPEDVSANRVTVGICTMVAVSAYVALVWNMYTGMVKNFDMTIRKQSR